MIQLTISKEIDIPLRYTIIPLLLTHIDNETLFNYVSRYIKIPDSYKTLLEQIENNMKHNNLNMTSFTFETNNNKRNPIKYTRHTKHTSHTKEKNSHTSHTKKHSTKLINKKQAKNIHQLFIIAINNHSYNKSKYDELLEIARVSGNAIFNTLKTNQIKNINIVDTIDGNYANDSNDSSDSSDTVIDNNVTVLCYSSTR